MADITLTASLVKSSDLTQGTIKRGVAGATIAAGDVIFKDAVTKTLKLSDADVVALAEADGVALCGAAAGQPVVYTAEDADFDLGVSVGAGTTVILSDTPGKMCPDADATTGTRKIVLGIAKGGTKLALKIIKGGTL